MRKGLVSLAVTAGLASFGLTSSAATKVVFNGAICQNIASPDTSFGNGLDYSQGETRNASSGYRYVVCPLVRMNGGGGGITDIEVSVSTSSSNSGTFCSALTGDRYTNNVTSESRDANASGVQVLDFASVSGAYYEGTYWVFCALASGAAVTSIVMDES